MTPLRAAAQALLEHGNVAVCIGNHEYGCDCGDAALRAALAEPEWTHDTLTAEIARALREDGWKYGDTFGGPFVDKIASIAARVALDGTKT